MAFVNNLVNGKIGESLIANWLKGKGYNILPIYEIEIGQGKGPAVYTADYGELIAPDLLVFKNKKVVWIEAKHKNAFAWNRARKIFVTGIDLKHYDDYKGINMIVDWPVWLLFLQKGGKAKDSPISPSGLYGNDLSVLMSSENHRSDKWGNGGMVYWAIDSLLKIAEYSLQKGIH